MFLLLQRPDGDEVKNAQRDRSPVEAYFEATAQHYQKQYNHSKLTFMFVETGLNHHL